MQHPRSATTPEFRRRAFIALEDVRLQAAYDAGTGSFAGKRLTALADIPQPDAVRDHFKRLRAGTLANLAQHLATFEANAQAAGATVHWAADGAEARAIILDLARQHAVSSVTKSKSMVSEEIGLNDALSAAGITPVETDLGEYLIQLADEPPAHIIAPAMHQTKEAAAELLSQVAGRPLDPTDIATLGAEARAQLRERFLSAGMGISGGNLLVAESGSLVLVENEGNIRLTTSAPRVHVAVVGIEKIVPTWGDAAVWLQLLPRSATGQATSIYTSIITGCARPDDPDGPRELHIVLLDNGRSELIGTPYEEVLQCIRCGACLNVCPVYREAGGHAYGSPYSGPIGAVISPLLFGREAYAGLPHASSLCGACRDACPARIDLPRMLLQLRHDAAESGLTSRPEQLAESAVAQTLRRAGLMRFVTGAARIAQRPIAAQNGLNLPPRLNPAHPRRLPALAPKSFRALWRDGEVPGVE